MPKDERKDSSKKKQKKKKKKKPFLTCFLRQDLILPYGFLLSDDPTLNANIMSKERKIRCVLTDEWEWHVLNENMHVMTLMERNVSYDLRAIFFLCFLKTFKKHYYFLIFYIIWIYCY
jgi:hypothetical protein